MSVDYAVSDDGGRLIVALSGDLGLSDVAELRLRLLKCLAEQPDVLLIDLSRMTLSDPLALAVFVAVRRQAARWPGIPMLLCAPEPFTGSHLRGAAYQSLPVFTTFEAARAHAWLERHTLPTLSDDLLPIAGAARQARDLATDACVRWGLPELLAPTTLIASELVSNVVDHAHTMMSLRLALRPRYLHLAVRDGDAGEPVLHPRADAAAARGRGLLLVESTAHCWGWLPTNDGKVVWASLRVGG